MARARLVDAHAIARLVGVDSLTLEDDAGAAPMLWTTLTGVEQPLDIVVME